MDDEHHNAFGGFAFSGSTDALSRLLEVAEGEGMNLLPVDLSDGIIRYAFPPDQSFNEKVIALINRTQAGEFGELSLTLLGSPARPPHYCPLSTHCGH
jgi:hypothetical protein